jgi:hypothetical protein
MERSALMVAALLVAVLLPSALVPVRAVDFEEEDLTSEETLCGRCTSGGAVFWLANGGLKKISHGSIRLRVHKFVEFRQNSTKCGGIAPVRILKLTNFGI